MAAFYFFDANAIVKRYVAEAGSNWVLSVTHPGSDSRIYIARITGAEVVAAIRKRERLRDITRAGAERALRDFEFDFVNQYRLCEVSAEVVSRAMALARKHPLKGYDAVQLASASVAREELLALGYHITFVSADRTLNHAAQAEGLNADNPDDHP